MSIYDTIDPNNYEKRHKRCPREAYLYKHWSRLIRKILSKYSKNRIVLDLGCGTGIYTEVISRYSKMHIGVDLSKKMIYYAKKKRKFLNLILADAHNLPFKDQSLDLIASIGLLEYVQKNVVMKEISRVLKRKALLIISVPNKYSACRLPAKILNKILRRKYIPKEPSFKEMLSLFHLNKYDLIWYKMNDGLIFLPDFLDRAIGNKTYHLFEKFFIFLGKNPFSNVMLFLAIKN